MRRLIERGERLAAGRAAQVLGRAAEAARDFVPRDVTIEAVEDGLRLSGSRLAARSIGDARLRAIGSLLKELLR